MHIYQGTTPYYDEGLARSADLGTLTHLAIARLAESGTPTLAQQAGVIATLLDGVRPIEKRAHRQNLRAAVMSYFSRLALPPQWQLLGAETPLGRGRVDLAWRDDEGRILLDEVKTGHHRRLATSTVQMQVHEYIASGRTRWGDAFLGCRLLSTHDPGSSTYTDTALRTIPLVQTSYRK
ncbi:PD-(D/E)XK nuclease family protein [Nocardioides sp. cx-169]|uniref:PD-(D/E)XK nuclease family protein n=1 Tax=Nocardioides sp. cx-169 TaxID=2899080 RepID=UPI001E300457|nr:PD-(D/E)XK nuclease family protein [Nocardioides sp. cx-169]MCD4532505.1 PD-(D/E)XK nuclease family protein [Nocardioides sp. cx-169]